MPNGPFFIGAGSIMISLGVTFVSMGLYELLK